MPIRLPRLYTYTIPYDDGAAPNPFFGMCTLAICKPGIRRTAQVGDWIAGLGAKTAQPPLHGKLVYAMRVTKIVTMEEYDLMASTSWPHRIPKPGSKVLYERLGDCIYDYSSGEAKLRNGTVHTDDNRPVDLGGERVLIADEFYYFGSDAIPVPPMPLPTGSDLTKIIHQTQGHKSIANDGAFDTFVGWIRSVGAKQGVGQLGWPGRRVDWENRYACGCAKRIDVDDGDEPD